MKEVDISFQSPSEIKEILDEYVSGPGRVPKIALSGGGLQPL